MQNNFEQQKAEFNNDVLLTLDRDSVKAEHTDKFIKLREIVNRHDPIGLIAIGTPEDEYEPEVMTIIVQLKNGMTEEQVHDLIYQEFMRWFNDESTVGPKNFYKELAKDVYDFSRSLE